MDEYHLIGIGVALGVLGVLTYLWAKFICLPEDYDDDA